MLYQERIPGRRGLWSRIAAHFALRIHSRRVADLDLLSLNPHLRRDLGLPDGESGLKQD